MIQTYSKDELMDRAGTEWENYRIQVADEYLKAIRDAERRKQLIADERELYKADLDGLSGIDYSKPNIMTSPSPDAIPNKVLKLLEYSQQLDVLETALDAAIEDAHKKLLSIEGAAGFVLRLHFMLGFKWEAAFLKAGVSDTKGYELRREGLLKVYDMGIPEKYGIPEAV